MRDDASFLQLSLIILFIYVCVSIVVVGVFECAVDGGLAGLHDLAADDHLVENLVDFVEIEHQVQLAHTSKVLVEHLHKQVNEL